MYVIRSIDLTSSLVSSTLAENDYSAWASGSTYSLGNRVISTTTHKTYEAAGPIATGINPTLAANQLTDEDVSGDNKWIVVGATNRWKPFDQHISDPASIGTSATWVFTAPSRITALAFFGLSAGAITIRVRNTSATLIHNETHEIVDTSDITNWFEFFFWEPAYSESLVLTDIPAFPGYELEIEVTAASGGEVGQIVAGPIVQLGTSGENTEIGFLSFSTKERDSFGNAVLLARDYADTVSFSFMLADRTDAARVRRLVSELDGSAHAWMASPDDPIGTLVFGFVGGDGFRVPLPQNPVATLEIEGLT